MIERVKPDFQEDFLVLEEDDDSQPQEVTEASQDSSPEPETETEAEAETMTEAEIEEFQGRLNAALGKYESQIPQRPHNFFPGAVSSWQKNESLMSQVLEGKTPKDRAKILEVIYAAEIEKDDPLFAVLLATGQLENLLNKQPTELKQIFRDWKQSWAKELKHSQNILEQEREQIRLLIDEVAENVKEQGQAALNVHKRNISKSVSDLVRKAAFEKLALNVNALIFAGLFLLGAVGIGFVLGLSVHSAAKKPTLAPGEPRQLTLEEASAMDWGMTEAGQFARSNPELIKWLRSSEGQYARQLMSWNQTLLSGKGKKLCEKDVLELGVTFKLEGRLSKNGFCLLWVRPPEQRKFVE